MSKSASRGVFISYRRQDTQHVAGRLYDRLVERFGSASVFMDVDSSDPGMEFGEAIDRAIERCRVLLVLIGQTWVNCTDNAGRRRLDDPDDLVAAEIKTALAKGLRVGPITVDGAALPRRADLPEELAPLMLRQAVRVEHETFRSDVQPLLDAIERALEEPAEQRPPARPIVERPADAAPPTSEPPIAVVSDAPTEVSGLERVRRALHLNPILGPVAVLALSTILFSILNGRFLSAANLGLILQQVSVIGTLALGQTLVILTAGIDLSAGAIAVFSSILMASFAAKLGIPGVLALVIGLVLGTMMGAFNGLMVTLTKLPPFIVTLGTLSIFFSLNDVVS